MSASRTLNRCTCFYLVEKSVDSSLGTLKSLSAMSPPYRSGVLSPRAVQDRFCERAELLVVQVILLKIAQNRVDSCRSLGNPRRRAPADGGGRTTSGLTASLVNASMNCFNGSDSSSSNRFHNSVVLMPWAGS